MGKDANLKAKNVRADGVFALQDAAGWTDCRWERGVFCSAGGLARKSCGKSRKSGCVSVRCSPFSGGTSHRLRDGWATWRRFRSWPFAPQAPGGAAAEWIVALCLLSGGSGSADDNCCDASVKATKRTTGCGGETKKRLGQSGDCLSRWRNGRPGCDGTLRRFGTMPHDCRGCPATERGSCMRRRGGRALEA